MKRDEAERTLVLDGVMYESAMQKVLSIAATRVNQALRITARTSPAVEMVEEIKRIAEWHDEVQMLAELTKKHARIVRVHAVGILSNSRILLSALHTQHRADWRVLVEREAGLL